MTATIDERIFDLNVKGYKIVITTHSAGKYEWLEENVPSAHGHWMISYNDPETGQAYCRGFIVSAPVGYSWAQARGRTNIWQTGVYATIQDCLDEIERRVAQQEAKLAEEHPADANR